MVISILVSKTLSPFVTVDEDIKFQTSGVCVCTCVYVHIYVADINT